MTSRDPRQQLTEARQIAKDHGMFLVERKGKATEYLLYRATPPRNTFIGKRSSPSGIRLLVAKAADFH